MGILLQILKFQMPMEQSSWHYALKGFESPSENLISLPFQKQHI
jgi:hypothetical protein